MTDVSAYIPVLPGQTLAGKYVVERVLGDGGMGVVVAARHVQLDSLVAIKFLLPNVMANQEAVSRFAREARAAVRIKSEHVARVTDVGTLDNGMPYMVMEYLEGRDLAELLTARVQLSVEDALDYVLQACQAIAEAHKLGIVHRDLKPSNLFLTRAPDGTEIVKVLDFGISKSIDMSASRATGSTTKGLLGSPTYMSPEQLRDARDVDARTDIWALGVVLYELLVGSPPFRGENLPDLFLAIMHNAPTRPDALRPDLPSPVTTAILRCLEKERSRRFSSIDDLAVALSAAAPARARVSIERIARLAARNSTNSTSTSPAVLPSGADAHLDVQPLQLSPGDGWGDPAFRRSSRRRNLLILAVPAAALLGYFAFTLLGETGASSTASGPLPSASAIPELEATARPNAPSRDPLPEPRAPAPAASSPRAAPPLEQGPTERHASPGQAQGGDSTRDRELRKTDERNVRPAAGRPAPKKLTPAPAPTPSAPEHDKGDDGWEEDRK